MRSSVDTACSGSSEEIKIGAGVLDYISELGNIQAKILEAYTYSEQCVQNIESEDTYQGEAREEMLAFFKSLASNMQKMTFLYQAAGTYIQNAYNTMYYNQTVDKVLRETSVSRSIFLCVYEIYSENRKFSLGLCHP